MLRELRLTQNELINTRKRWFQDDYFDLFTWQDDTDHITSFQLCYDRLNNERVIAWDNEKGFGHHRVDDGEASPHKNMTPVFVSDGPFSAEEVIPRFERANQQMNGTISCFVIQKIIEYVLQQQLGTN